MASVKPSVRSRTFAPPSRAPPPANARSTYDAYRDEQEKASGKKDAVVDAYKGQSTGEKVSTDSFISINVSPRLNHTFVSVARNTHRNLIHHMESLCCKHLIGFLLQIPCICVALVYFC